jgi:hypothetical protein
VVDIGFPGSRRGRASGSLDGTAGRETVRPVDSSSATRIGRGPRDRDPGMTIESIHRISITAMVLLLVLAAAAAQTTSTQLYVDGVPRVVATSAVSRWAPSRSTGPWKASGLACTRPGPGTRRERGRFFKASRQRFRGRSGQTSS